MTNTQNAIATGYLTPGSNGNVVEMSPYQIGLLVDALAMGWKRNPVEARYITREIDAMRDYPGRPLYIRDVTGLTGILDHAIQSVTDTPKRQGLWHLRRLVQSDQILQQEEAS